MLNTMKAKWRLILHPSYVNGLFINGFLKYMKYVIFQIIKKKKKKKKLAF